MLTTSNNISWLTLCRTRLDMLFDDTAQHHKCIKKPSSSVSKVTLLLAHKGSCPSKGQLLDALAVLCCVVKYLIGCLFQLQTYVSS